MKEKLIIAHRGATDLATENTIEAFSGAMESGADMIELDIRMTRDQKPVVFHDKQIVGRPIHDLEFNEVFELGLGQGIKIPTLEDVLQFTSGKIKLDIELKVRGHEKEIASRALNYFATDQCIFSSFNIDSLNALKKFNHRIQVGLILGKERSKKPISTRLGEIFPFNHQIIDKVDYVIPHWKLLKFGFLKRSQRHDIKVWVWTVNDRTKILKYLRDPRITGIITDKPDLVFSLQQSIGMLHDSF
ncbi:MAG: glycerophosphodiester phosphodiesterase [Candidatus Aminicenantes bacterium]|nr:glycerophosphodiester phosphodiesterase [Candidatus Aminicenantes bacterium]